MLQMERTASRILTRIFYAMFAAIFTVLVAALILGNVFHQWGWSRIPLTALFLGALAWVFYLCKRYEAVLEKHYGWILTVVLTVMLILQIVIGSALRFTPAWDLDAIYSGAIQWAETGSFSSYYEYYQYFPNNLGGMALLYLFFKPAQLVGISDYFMVAVTANSVLLVGTILITSLAGKLLFGTRGGVFVLFLFVAALPFYFMGAVFYTDTLSMIFLVLFYYLYLRFTRASGFRNKLLIAVGMGLTLGVGISVKFTVAIIAIAVTVDALLFHRPWCKVALLLAGTVTIAAAVYFFFHAYIYAFHLDPVQAEQMNTPITHWIMMGLKGNGGYNGSDYQFTRSFADPAARNEAIWQEIQSRIASLKLTGLLKLWIRKEVLCFGDGTFVLSSFLDDTPLNQTFLHQIVMENGALYPLYRQLCVSGFCAVLLLVLVSSYRDASSGGSVNWRVLTPRLAIFGLLLFFLLWETSGRLILNFVPIIFLAALPGAELRSSFDRKNSREKR